MVNVQHNCRANNCSFSATRSIYQEREEFRNKAKEIVHINPDDIMLNCVKMHDYRYVGIFKIEPATIDQMTLIREGAEREIFTNSQSPPALGTSGAPKEHSNQVCDERSADEMLNGEGGYDSD